MEMGDKVCFVFQKEHEEKTNKVPEKDNIFPANGKYRNLIGS